jgi:hypothetical protein
MSPTDRRIARALDGAPKLVIATVALMEELARVLTMEIDVVTKRKTKEHPALLKRKQRLAIDYRSNMKSIGAQPDILQKLPDAAKDAVREMSKHLADAVDANARVLRAAVDATRQLILNVMAMVRSETMPRQSYKNHAKEHLQLGTYSPTCRPVAISRTV